MTPERLRELEAVFSELSELEPGERERGLSAVADVELREHARALLDTSDAELAEIIACTASSVLNTLEPARFGPWRVTGILGHGGMGAVYRAVRTDGVYEREVAIKILPSAVENAAMRNRFRQERQILAGLDHPNIARMLDGGESQAGPYIVLECVDGKDIVSYCNERNLNVQDRLRLLVPVCAAVHYAHSRGIIHRDIKPGNVLVKTDGTPKLLDFGIAKLVEQDAVHTVAGFQAFTPQYASPEQIRGGPVTAATDVYALGALLYELLTGACPHLIKSGDPAELVRVICERQVTPPSSVRRDLSREIDLILNKALQKDTSRRYASAELMAGDIERYLEGRSVLARPDSLINKGRTFVQRHRTSVFAAASLLVIGILISAHFLARSPATAQMVVMPITSFPGTEGSPSFSPDGRELGFSWDGDNGAFDIYVKHLVSGSLKRVTYGPEHGVDAVWSPDGSRMAYLRLKRDSTELVLRTAEGKERTLATSTPPEQPAMSLYGVFRYYSPAWSPSGNEIAMVGACPSLYSACIYSVEASSGTKRLLTSPGTRMLGDRMPAFSPDGSLLAFARSKTLAVSDIYIQSLATRKLTRLTFDAAAIDGLTWSHDGREIIFSSERSGAPELWRKAIAGGPTQPIYVGAQRVLQPVISPDGNRLAIVEDVTNQNIWRIPVHSNGRDGSTPTKLISSSRLSDSPRYSPDGKHLAFASERSGTWQIWVADADGSNAVAITSFDHGLTGSPSWSPDSRQIVFDSRQGDYSAVYTISASGGTPHRITEETSDNMLPSWSRDGHWIYFNSNRSGRHEIWKKPAAGGDAIQITTHGAYEPYESYDGRYLYYWKYEGSGVWRIPVSGGAEERVAELAGYQHTRYFDIAPDGIYFVNDRNTPHPIEFFSFRTHKVSRVAELDGRLVNGTPGLTVSPDGKWIVYARVDYDSTDIYMVDHFR